MRKEGPFQELCQSDAHSQKKCWILFKNMMQENPKLWMFLVFWSVAIAFWWKKSLKQFKSHKPKQSKYPDILTLQMCIDIVSVMSYLLPWMFSLSTGQPTSVTAAGFVLAVSTSRPSSKVWKYSSAITYRLFIFTTYWKGKLRFLKHKHQSCFFIYILKFLHFSFLG